MRIQIINLIAVVFGLIGTLLMVSGTIDYSEYLGRFDSKVPDEKLKRKQRMFKWGVRILCFSFIMQMVVLML